jgi:hypothetical protein
MQSLSWLVFAALIAQVTANDTLSTSMDPNPRLQSYTATASLEVHLHAIFPISRHFQGTATYVRPKGTVTFDNVPRALASLKTLGTTSPTLDQAAEIYTIAFVSDHGAHTVYSFVPKDTGSRVSSLTAAIDDCDKFITQVAWKYHNGATLSIQEKYATVGGYRLPTNIAISARFPGYSVDGAVELNNYREIAPAATDDRGQTDVAKSSGGNICGT